MVNKKNLSEILALMLVFVLGLILTGCGSGKIDSPTTAAKGWVQAFIKGDATALGKVSTPESAATTSSYIPMLQAQFASNPVQEYSENISEDGDSAVVTVTFKDNKTDTIKLVKRDGKWLVNEMNEGGTSQEIVTDPTPPYVGKSPVYAYYTDIGSITVATKDSSSNKYSVSVIMNLGYDIEDMVASGELASRQVELRDFVRSYFQSKYAADLVPEKNEQIKREILEILNTRFLDTAKVQSVMFDKFDVMEIY